MNPTLRTILIAGGAFIVAGFFLRRTVADFNKDTPFEGTGIVGGLGNAADQASGGVLSNIGSAIGGALADLRDAVVGEGEIDCSHFNRNTARGEELFQRCQRGEL